MNANVKIKLVANLPILCVLLLAALSARGASTIREQGEYKGISRSPTVSHKVDVAPLSRQISSTTVDTPTHDSAIDPRCIVDTRTLKRTQSMQRYVPEIPGFKIVWSRGYGMVPMKSSLEYRIEEIK
jgi:hypothetical protein